MATSVEEVRVKCIEYIDINRFVLALKYLILFELKHVCFQKYHKVQIIHARKEWLRVMIQSIFEFTSMAKIRECVTGVGTIIISDNIKLLLVCLSQHEENETGHTNERKDNSFSTHNVQRLEPAGRRLDYLLYKANEGQSNHYTQATTRLGWISDFSNCIKIQVTQTQYQ